MGAATHILTVDVGNTTTRLGVYTLPADGEDAAAPELIGACDLTTPDRATADELRIQLAQAQGILPMAELAGSILSCVVPTLTETWRHALASVAQTRPLVVGPGLKSGIRMRYDDPSEVGADRIAGIVAARAAYELPAVVVDLGTTTNFDVIDATGTFAGGIIAPGVALGAQSLARAAARLPIIELAAPKSLIGTSTRSAMQSGVVFGEVARIDGLIEGIAGELGAAPTVILTGGDAARIAPLLKHAATVDGDLTLRGLALLWQKNRRS